MMNPIKPLVIALKGKGPVALIKRARSIGQRYGLTNAKMDDSLEHLYNILHQFNCQATFPITAIALGRNGAIIQKYQEKGIEFAIHGCRHIDYSQLSLQDQEIHFQQAKGVFQDQNIHFAGFRCPYLRWNEDTLTALKQIDSAYDSSSSLVWEIADKHKTDSYFRALNFYGAQPASDYLALPYLNRINKLVRIPYCLPDDESLIERLQWNSHTEMEQVWPTMFHQIHERGELFTLGLHPERTNDCANALIATLKEVRTVGASVWCARLEDIAGWWQARFSAFVETIGDQDNNLQLTVNGPVGTTLLLRALETKTATKPWFNGYKLATEGPCTIQTSKRPFIGLSPDSPSALGSFLKQQGYIIETSSNPDLYSLYLDYEFFSRQEERALIAKIETSNFPLARLGRWPNGARSAFCITGDIDALTLWDYGLRFIGR